MLNVRNSVIIVSADKVSRRDLESRKIEKVTIRSIVIIIVIVK